jgi:glycosyltransferase involved in cell wall biosynthesis
MTILLVAQFSPPAGFSAARRVAGLTKYLARAGHRVVVLSSLASGRGPIEGAERIVRTRDLVVTDLNWRRKHFERLRSGGDVGYESRPSRMASVVVPDLVLASWLPFALPRALKLAAEERPDWVMTTSPPESAHLIGLALQRRGVGWVADLRDGWGFETTHPDWPTGAQRKLDLALERICVQRADLVTAVTDPITEDLRTRLSARAVTVPNGFDPEEAGQAPQGQELLSSERFSLVHTGRLGFVGRSLEPLLEGLELLQRRRPELGGRLELVLAGALSEPERRQLDGDGTVRALGMLPRERALALQAAADCLLLVTGRDRRSEATAKLYEYLAAERPILVLGEKSAAAEVVRQAGAGLAASATDPADIANALESTIDGEVAVGGSDARERWAYPKIARQLEQELASLRP